MCRTIDARVKSRGVSCDVLTNSRGELQLQLPLAEIAHGLPKVVVASSASRDSRVTTERLKTCFEFSDGALSLIHPSATEPFHWPISRKATHADAMFGKKKVEEEVKEETPLERLKAAIVGAGVAKCSAAAGGALLAVCVLRSLGAKMKRAKERRLADKYSGAVEVLLCKQAAGANVVLVPSAEQPEESGGKLPETLCSHLVFALTAFDPPGETRTLEENTDANTRMWRSIQAMEPAPAKVWPAWAYNLDENWREDGFCLAFLVAGGEEEAETARAAVIALAKEYDQLAVFEYVKGETEDSMLRTTVPVTGSEAIRKEVTVWRVPEPVVPAPGDEGDEGEAAEEAEVDEGDSEKNALLQRPWAGPEEVLGAEEPREPATPASFKSVQKVLAEKEKESARQRRWWSRHKVGPLSPIRNLFP